MRRRFLAASLGLAALLVLAAAITFTHGWGFLFKPAPGAGHGARATDGHRSEDGAAASPQATPKDLRAQARSVGANELGHVPVLVYHQIGPREGRWTRTPDNFRQDLAELHRRGYVLVTLSDYLDGKIDVPAGRSPAVITFDDGTPGHFRLLEKDGGLQVDPDCAVGILLDFGKRHPGFGHAATFFINGRPFGGEPGQEQYWQQKLRMLVEWGFEIGNHTLHHANLKNLPPEKVRAEIAGLQAHIQQAVPGYRPSAFAIVQDGLPEPYATVVEGTYGAVSYRHRGVVWWAWSAAPSPFHREFDPLRVQRIQVFQDHGASSLVNWLDRIEPTRYVSDGNPETIAVPKGWEEALVDKPGRQVVVYDAAEVARTPGAEKQAAAAKGVHVTFSWASSPARWQQILALVDQTRLTAVQLDVKDESGRIGYLSGVSLGREIGAAHDYLPIREMLEDLRARGIYSVARIVVFRDPVLAQKRPALMVRTKSGRPVAGGVWVNPASREVWDYNVALAREAYALGFDEVQFDYIRFPEGSGAESAVYPGMGEQQRTDVIAAFTRYAREQLGWEKRLSAAVFGFMGVAVDDQRIGQRPERMAPYLDYISPMAYPSHYSPGNYGFANPNAHPYEVVAGTLGDFARLITTSGCRLRPWLQAFTLGHPPYGPAQIQAQIRATEERGIHTWLLWNPGVVYKAEAIGR